MEQLFEELQLGQQYNNQGDSDDRQDPYDKGDPSDRLFVNIQLKRPSFDCIVNRGKRTAEPDDPDDRSADGLEKIFVEDPSEGKDDHKRKSDAQNGSENRANAEDFALRLFLGIGFDFLGFFFCPLELKYKIPELMFAHMSSHLP